MENCVAKIVDLKHEWALAIGRAFVSFGSIEHIVVVGLREVPRDRIHRSIRALGLGQRIALLVEILEGHDGELYAGFAEALKQAKLLAETRNLIAHNPLVLEVYEFKDGEHWMREVIAGLHNDKRLDLKELQKFASDAEALCARLYELGQKVFLLCSATRQGVAP